MQNLGNVHNTSRIFIILFLFCSLLYADVFNIDGVDFHYRVPYKFTKNSKLIILFGGRNWSGEKTIKTYNFDPLADKYQAFLLSPSFKDNNYWEPEKWSGDALKKAIKCLENKHNLSFNEIYFYGYSAGGQCAALFYNWMPDKVVAWGAHACGVYPDKLNSTNAKVLITCGEGDIERYHISKQFIFNYREHNGFLLWKPFKNLDHRLSPDVLLFAREWFDAILNKKAIMAYGEDDTLKIDGDIDIEYKNPLYSAKLLELWQK